MNPMQISSFLTFLIVTTSTWWSVASFTNTATKVSAGNVRHVATQIRMSSDGSDLVARKIIVTGAVQGGYYRSCVLNEAGRFRKLVGTMSPPDDSDEAEIYVEVSALLLICKKKLDSTLNLNIYQGKKKMVDGFVRWCQRGNVGLSQVTKVKDIFEEDPTGLYDGFYVNTK
mmetsp:Transcript_7835/g.12262  ORF Transcript_7835/g.12262 Transcript_7835/m.12262 type:complete len:171 (-) Transcript_7835:250-762(-)